MALDNLPSPSPRKKRAGKLSNPIDPFAEWEKSKKLLPEPAAFLARISEAPPSASFRLKRAEGCNSWKWEKKCLNGKFKNIYKTWRAFWCHTSKLKRVLSFQSGEDAKTAGRLEQKIKEKRFDVAISKIWVGPIAKKDALATHGDFGKTRERNGRRLCCCFQRHTTTGNNTVDNDDVLRCACE